MLLIITRHRAEETPRLPPRAEAVTSVIFSGGRPSGASPPICRNDSAAGSELLNDGCQSSEERFKMTFQFPFPPSSSVLTPALFIRADVCFGPRVFRWIDVFEREAFVLLKEHDGVRFPIPRSCLANCQRLTSC